MRRLISLFFALVGCAFADINAVNGVAADTDSNINGVTTPSAVNGLSLVSGGSPPAISYISTGADTSDQTVYTFTSQSIGTAASDRIVGVGIVARSTTSNTIAVSSVTVQGITATLTPGTASALPNGASSECTEIWTASVPTGTTGTVVVTLNAGAARCAIVIYRMTGISGTPSDVAIFGNAASSTSPITLNADVTSTSVVFAIAGWVGTAVSTWVGASEDVDPNLETYHYTAAHYTSSGAETPRTFSATPGLASSDRIGSLAVFN